MLQSAHRYLFPLPHHLSSTRFNTDEDEDDVLPLFQCSQLTATPSTPVSPLYQLASVPSPPPSPPPVLDTLFTPPQHIPGDTATDIDPPPIQLPRNQSSQAASPKRPIRDRRPPHYLKDYVLY